MTYGPFDGKPEELLRRIAAMREMNRPAAGPPVVAGNGESQCRGAVAGRAAAGRSSSCETSALPWPPGRSPRPESMCRQLDAMHISDFAFGPGEDMPRCCYEAVHEAQRRLAMGGVTAGRRHGRNGRRCQLGRLRPFARPNSERPGRRPVSVMSLPAPPSQPGGRRWDRTLPVNRPATVSSSRERPR